MKNLFRLTVCVSFVIILQSCATMSLNELRPVGRISTPLPYLEPDIDIYSIESVYSLWTTRRSSDIGISVSASVNASDGDTGSHVQPYYYIDSPSSYVRRRDQRIQDAITIFSREITDNISSPIGKPCGVISCRIAAGVSEVNGQVLTLLSACMLFAPSFLGLPACFYTTELDVDCDIYDLNGDCVGRYTACGKSRVPVALYYGYSTSSAERKSAAEALKKAMKEIKLQIERDAGRLNAVLR